MIFDDVGRADSSQGVYTFDEGEKVKRVLEKKIISNRRF
jgi:hypothetical protein